MRDSCIYVTGRIARALFKAKQRLTALVFGAHLNIGAGVSPIRYRNLLRIRKWLRTVPFATGSGLTIVVLIMAMATTGQAAANSNCGGGDGQPIIQAGFSPNYSLADGSFVNQSVVHLSPGLNSNVNDFCLVSPDNGTLWWIYTYAAGANWCLSQDEGTQWGNIATLQNCNFNSPESWQLWGISTGRESNGTILDNFWNDYNSEVLTDEGNNNFVYLAPWSDTAGQFWYDILDAYVGCPPGYICE